MSTIIRHVERGEEYVLVGSGLGMFRASRPHWFLGDLGKTTEDGVHACVCAADGEGRLCWFDSDEVVVVRVGDASAGEVLSG